MVAHVSGERMRLPLVPLAALLVGGVFALSAAAAPTALLDTVFAENGICGWLSLPWSEAARPMVMVATGAIGSGAGALAALLAPARRPADVVPLVEAEDVTRMPIIRRADAHPDARPRPPLRVDQEVDLPAPPLGMPLSIAAAAMTERDIPVDLDQPLAAFDPEAIPTVPLPPPVPPRRERMADAGARAGLARDPAERLVRPETDATVHALLDRLERGVVRRNQGVQGRGKARPERSPEDALATLRNLARQA